MLLLMRCWPDAPLCAASCGCGCGCSGVLRALPAAPASRLPCCLAAQLRPDRWYTPSNRLAAARRGLLGNILAVMYYGAPLSTALHVVRTRCSGTIYKPLCLVNAACGSLWIGYGLVRARPGAAAAARGLLRDGVRRLAG